MESTTHVNTLRQATWVALVGAGLWLLAGVVPFAFDRSLNDSGGQTRVLVFGTVALVVGTAWKGLTGSAVASYIAVGTLTGLGGWVTILMIVTHRSLSFTGGDSPAQSEQAGFYFAGAAVAAAVIALIMALAASGGHRTKVATAGVVIGAITTVALPLAILLPKHDRTLWSLETGGEQVGTVIWAFSTVALAVWAIITSSRAATATLLGAVFFQLIAVASTLFARTFSAGARRFEVTRPELWAPAMAIAAVSLIVALSDSAARRDPFGQHRQAAYCRSCGAGIGAAASFCPFCGQATLATPTGQVPMVTGQYNAVTTTQPTVAAQWAADPFGRYEYRYWNGKEWTSSVSSHGVQSTDPAAF